MTVRKLLKRIILPAILALIFIVSTAIVAQSSLSLSPFGRFCFFFHTIPFNDGFSGANVTYMWIYYLVLWLILTYIILAFKTSITIIFNRYFK